MIEPTGEQLLERLPKMSEIPQPKYKIGDVVFTVHAREFEHRLPCPDCNGTGKWTITTGRGETFETACGRCGYRHNRNVGTSLNTVEWTPVVTSLTIGQIKLEWPIDTYGDNKDAYSYMCEETGVGSGQIHRESSLFSSYDEAKAQGDRICEEARRKYNSQFTTQWSLELAKMTCDLSIKMSKSREAWNFIYHNRQIISALKDALNDDLSDLEPGQEPGPDRLILTEKQKSVVRTLLKDHLYHFLPETNPLCKLVEICREVASAESELGRLLKEHFEFIPTIEEIRRQRGY